MSDDARQADFQRLSKEIEAGRSQHVAMTLAEPSFWASNNPIAISSVVFGFGIFVILIAAFLIRSGKGAESVLRVLGTILIIFAALFLVVAGYSDKQIAPVMGLLGTIAGYLLGRETRDS